MPLPARRFPLPNPLGSVLPAFVLPTLVLTAFVLGAPAARAQDAETTGIPSCDAFLAAYARCAASPGIPEAARGPIRDGVANLRTSFREAAGRDERARAPLARQCAASHAQVRATMVQSFKCDFPDVDPALAAAPLPPAPAGGAPPASAPTTARSATPAPASPEELNARKANAYAGVQNRVVEHGTGKQLADHLRNNERVLKLGTKLGANAWYLFGVTPFERIAADLRAAIALPGRVPEVDDAAARLLAAMEAVDPVIKRLDRYQTTRAFQDDGFKLAREQEAPLVSGLRAVMNESAAFEGTLFERRMGIDEKRLETLPEAALSRSVLGTSLATRRLLRQYEALAVKNVTDAFAKGLADVLRSNEALHARLESLDPKPEGDCTSYAEDVDAMVGKGRDLLRDIRAKSSITQSSEDFADRYNRSVDHLNRCRQREARAR